MSSSHLILIPPYQVPFNALNDIYIMDRFPFVHKNCLIATLGLCPYKAKAIHRISLPLRKPLFISLLCDTMLTSLMESKMSTIPTHCIPSPVNHSLRLSMDNLQSPIPLYSLNQCFHASSSNRPFLVSTNLEIAVGTSTYQNVCLEYQSRIVHYFSTSSPLLTTSIDGHHLGDIDPQFSILSSTMMTQASNMRDQPQKPYHDPNFSYINHVGNSSFPTMENSTLDPSKNLMKNMRKCKTCHMEFSTPQALGGHMSSHSKAKKALNKRERLASACNLSILKKPKLEPHSELANQGIKPEDYAHKRMNITKLSKELNASVKVINKCIIKKEEQQMEKF